MLVSHYIINFLKENDVDVIFGVGGANIEDIYDAIFYRGAGIRAVIAKHEFSAVTMADGYSRTSRKLGVVVSTSGGGAFNLIPGLAEAFASRVPLLAIVGQVPQHLEGKGGFQDSSGLAGTIDAERVFQPVSKYCQRIISVGEVPQALHNAIELALTEPCGPSVLLLPKNIQSTTIDPPNLQPVVYSNYLNSTEKLNLHEGTIQKIFNLLCENPQKINVLCGERAVQPQVKKAVKELVSLLNATVVVTTAGKSAFDNHSPNFCGVVGIMGHPSAVEALNRAEICIVIGTRLSVMSRFGLESLLDKMNIIYINDEPPFVDYKKGSLQRLELIGSISVILNKLLADLAEHKWTRKQMIDFMLPPTLTFLPTPASSTAFKSFMIALDDVIEPTAHVVIDAGNAGAAAAHFIKAPQHGTFTIALGTGGMGYSFGAAIGACLSNGHKTYVIAGDGSFFMHGLEIHTAVELELPIIFIIFNNNAHAMCITREMLYYKASYSYNRFKNTDISAGIHGFFPSIPAFSVKTATELKETLNQIKGFLKPALVCVEIDAIEMPPFKPFLEQMANSSFNPINQHKETLNYEN